MYTRARSCKQTGEGLPAKASKFLCYAEVPRPKPSGRVRRHPGYNELSPKQPEPPLRSAYVEGEGRQDVASEMYSEYLPTDDVRDRDLSRIVSRTEFMTFRAATSTKIITRN